MKKKLTLSLACLLAVSVYGQEINNQDMLNNVNWKEDSTEITTIDDIVKMQQDVTYKRYKEKHYRDVWSRKGYFNIGYNTTTLTPDENIYTGVGTSLVPEFKSSWGVSIQSGRSYALHNTPIANILQFNIDFSYIDLNVNHFKQEGDGKNLYDSRVILPNSDNKDYFFTPWNLEKYDINYGMAVGPSVSVAPFTSTSFAGLHHVKLNAFFHVGYHVSLLWMKNDSGADANQQTVVDFDKDRYDRMDDNLKLDLGHGLITSFGFSVTWKFIGLGYEHRSGALKYKSLTTREFGKETYKFKSSTNRIFIQFRM